MIYAIAVKEVLKETVLVNAETLEDAIQLAQDSYDNGEIVIDYDNFLEADINASSNWKNGIYTGSEEMKQYYLKLGFKDNI